MRKCGDVDREMRMRRDAELSIRKCGDAAADMRLRTCGESAVESRL